MIILRACGGYFCTGSVVKMPFGKRHVFGVILGAGTVGLSYQNYGKFKVYPICLLFQRLLLLSSRVLLDGQ